MKDDILKILSLILFLGLFYYFAEWPTIRQPENSAAEEKK